MPRDQRFRPPLAQGPQLISSASDDCMAMDYDGYGLVYDPEPTNPTNYETSQQKNPIKNA